MPYDIRALLGMTDDSAAGTISKSTAAQQEVPDVSRALLGWDTQAPGANRQAVPAVGEAKGFNIQAVPYDIRALLGWEGKNAVENGSAPGYNNNWKNTAEANSRDSLADNPLLLTGKYGKYRDSTNPDLPLPPGLQDDASAFAYIDTQKAYESARAEMEQSGELPNEDAGDAGKITDGGNNTKFTYKNNPMDNPKASKDIVENPNAVYGYSPNPSSKRIGSFESQIDWSNPNQVEIARQSRVAYHEKNQQMLDDLYGQGYSTEDIARKIVNERNANRLKSYLEKGDLKRYEIVRKSNLDTYKNANGPSPEFLLKKYGSWDGVIEAALRSNPGMDACVGLYDLYHGGK